MTLDDAQWFIRSIRADQRPMIFCGDLDEFYCDSVDDTDGLRKAVWVKYTDDRRATEVVLAKFRTWEEAEAFMRALSDSTGVRDPAHEAMLADRFSEYDS